MSPAFAEAKWRQFLTDVQLEWPKLAADLIKVRDIPELVSLLRRASGLPEQRIALEVQAMLRVFEHRLRCAQEDLPRAA
jgi:hypothetical protein